MIPRKRGPAILAMAMVVLPLYAPTTAVAGEPSIPGLTVTSDISFVGVSFVLTGDVTVQAGGRLTLDNTTILVRMSADLDIGFRVEAGGELVIINNSRITSTFVSVGYSVHYMVFVEPGGHLVLRDSTIDSAYAIGVGDETAVMENVTISNAYMGLYGTNLTVNRGRFLGNTIGFWVSGNSLMRDIEGRSHLVYVGILDGNSRLEGGTFLESTAGDIQLLDNASAANTTHRRSARGYILNGNASVENVTVLDALYGAIQLGDADFRYGCGIFNGSIPEEDWLNLHLFPWFYRVNNTVRVTDLNAEDSGAGIFYARQIWRRAVTYAFEASPRGQDDCISDPPPLSPAEPLFNTVEWRVTRGTTVAASRNDFNGTIEIMPGGSLTLRGGDTMFISAGETQRAISRGASFALLGALVRSALANYTTDSLEFGRNVAPGVDVDIQAGSIAVVDSVLQNLGTDPDPASPAGLVVRRGAGPLQMARTTVNESTRGVVLGCCTAGGAPSTDAFLDGVRLEGQGPMLELWDARVEAANSTLSQTAGPSIRASGGASRASLYATGGVPSGPGALTIERFGAVQSRVVWQDQRPVAGAAFTATDTVSAQVMLDVTTDASGWTPFAFVRYATSTWDGITESSPSPHPFMLVATYRNISTTLAPVDISQPATRTLVLPDEGAPVLNLSLPPITFTNRNYGTVNGSARDFETGVSLVEVALDSGAYIRITPPGPPAEGVLTFSTDYSGLATGIHALTFRAWDTVGNAAEASVLIVVDPLPPSLFLDQPFNLTTNVRDFNFTGRLSEPGSVTADNRTAQVTEDDLGFSLPFHLASDSEVLQLVVTDIAGNSVSHNLVIRLDQVPPELSLTSPADGAYVTTPDLLLVGTMEPTATLYLNGVRLNIGGTSSFSIPAALSEGENSLELRAMDLAGNEAAVRFTLHLDTGLPSLDILSPDGSRPLAASSFTIVLRTEAGASVKVGDVTVTATEPVVTVPYTLPDGRHSLALEVSDRAGNVVRRVLSLTVDTREPTLSVSGGDGQRTANDTFRLIGQTEPGAFVRIGQWESQADTVGVFALNLRLHPGENQVAIVAWDLAGNQANLTVSITLDQPDPAAPAGVALPTGGTVALLLAGAALVALAAPVARRVARLLAR
ncbi:MAG TPA: hypothetical protein VGB42_10940 [Candidatus Thermoplasmatota archaeon]